MCIFKFTKGSTWLTHRPPTIKYPSDTNIVRKHIDSNTLYETTGVQMYHYSYTFPDQVYKKVSYYKDSISKENCIDNYFNEVYLPWVRGERSRIETTYNGVHEFKPQFRGECKTKKFEWGHPKAIANNLHNLRLKFKKQLKNYVK